MRSRLGGARAALISSRDALVSALQTRRFELADGPHKGKKRDYLLDRCSHGLLDGDCHRLVGAVVPWKELTKASASVGCFSVMLPAYVEEGEPCPNQNSANSCFSQGKIPNGICR